MVELDFRRTIVARKLAAGSRSGRAPLPADLPADLRGTGRSYDDMVRVIRARLCEEGG